MENTAKPSPSNKLPRELQEADCKHWGAANLWTAEQAACLLCGWEPVNENVIPPGEVRDRITGLKSMLEKDTGKSIFYFDCDAERRFRYFPWKVIEWADAAPISVPFKLRSAVLEAFPSQFRTGALVEEIHQLKRQIADLEGKLAQQKFQSGPPYVKRDHMAFAPELAAAVSAWMELYETKTLTGQRGDKKRILRWLTEKYNSRNSGGNRLSINALERIATVVNFNKL